MHAVVRFAVVLGLLDFLFFESFFLKQHPSFFPHPYVGSQKSDVIYWWTESSMITLDNWEDKSAPKVSSTLAASLCQKQCGEQGYINDSFVNKNPEILLTRWLRPSIRLQ